MRANPSILLIESSSLMRRAVQEVFEEEGYDVSGASTPQDAMLTVAERPFDVILMTLSEPEFRAGDVPPLLDKALGTPATVVLREPTLRLGRRRDEYESMVEAVLDKPVSIDDLRRLVRDCLFRRMSLGPGKRSQDERSPGHLVDPGDDLPTPRL